jgi:hypothetical protein
MQYYWTKDSLYRVALNRTTRRFYVDYLVDRLNKNSLVNVIYNLDYLKSWYINNTSVLIALKNRNYIYISSKIIHFSMDEGDMIVRFIPSYGNMASSLITRFNTIFINEDEEPYYLIDKTISRPPELNVGFRIDEEFKTKYAMLYHQFILMHSGKDIRNIYHNNV